MKKTEYIYELSEPFKPLQQLMAVLPAKSSHLVPDAFRNLMTDDNSPIIQFYSTDFKIDPNGQFQPWLYVTLLPPLDEKLLLETLSTKEDKLSFEEKERNTTTDSELYISNNNQYYKDLLPFILDVYFLILQEFTLTPYFGIIGLIKKINENNNKYIHVYYCLEKNRQHITSLLPKSMLPPMILNGNDAKPTIITRRGVDLYKYILANSN